jgi:hypothetical protein
VIADPLIDCGGVVPLRRGRRETTETIMNADQGEDGTTEKIGYVLSIIFIAALAALFLYGYLPHFL